MPKTELLRSSPLAEVSIIERLWARLRAPDSLRVGVPSALVLLLVLTFSTWGLVGRSNQPQPPNSGTSGGDPEATAASPAPAITPPVVSSATLRIHGENPFNDATIYAYANDKLIRRARLQKKTNDEKFTLSIAVVPGRHTISIRMVEAGKGFDQTSAIECQLGLGHTRTLEVDFQRQVKLLGRHRFVLRWLD